MPDAAGLQVVPDRLRAFGRSGSVGGKRDYQLWSERTVVIDGRKRDEVCFAGVIAQKRRVGAPHVERGWIDAA